VNVPCSTIRSFICPIETSLPPYSASIPAAVIAPTGPPCGRSDVNTADNVGRATLDTRRQDSKWSQVPCGGAWWRHSRSGRGI